MVQPYTVNGEKIVHIARRSSQRTKEPKRKSLGSVYDGRIGGKCINEECGCSLQKPYMYCSIECKVKWEVKPLSLCRNVVSDYDEEKMDNTTNCLTTNENTWVSDPYGWQKSWSFIDKEHANYVPRNYKRVNERFDPEKGNFREIARKGIPRRSKL